MTINSTSTMIGSQRKAAGTIASTGTGKASTMARTADPTPRSAAWNDRAPKPHCENGG